MGVGMGLTKYNEKCGGVQTVTGRVNYNCSYSLELASYFMAGLVGLHYPTSQLYNSSESGVVRVGRHDTPPKPSYPHDHLGLTR